MRLGTQEGRFIDNMFSGAESAVYCVFRGVKVTL